MRLTSRRVVIVGALFLVITAAGAAWLWRFRAERAAAGGPPDVVVTYLNTSLYDVQRTAYRRWIADTSVMGGALAGFADGFLLATGDGRLFFFKEKPGRDGLDIRRLDSVVPLNAGEFDSDARRILGAPAELQNFRVADILVTRQGSDVQLIASHHYWRRSDSCFVLRVSMLESAMEALLDNESRSDWRTLFETTPCLPLNRSGLRGARFGGHQAGGRMVMLGDGQLLLTVGDHDFDGWNRTPAYPQDPASSYGKTLLIQIATGAAEVYSLGHRNSQGLDIDAQGVTWSAEHGPFGGDEINVIRRGSNYGWPRVTYGTEYGMHGWPGNEKQGRHEGFEKPVFAFVPSRGISQLVALRGTRFQSWKGDLLAGFLVGARLERVRIEEGRAVYSERLSMGRRIRDVMEASDGRIVVWTDEGEIDFLEPSDRVAGESSVAKCTACHGMRAWDPSILGPSLFKIVDREVAARDDFQYSPAMRAFGGEWTTERLDAFLANPQATVPGTTMQMPGIRDAAERAAIVNYLKAFAR